MLQAKKSSSSGGSGTPKTVPYVNPLSPRLELGDDESLYRWTWMDNASPNHYSVEEYPGTQATKNFTVSFPSDKVLLYFVEYRTVFSVIKIDLFK